MSVGCRRPAIVNGERENSINGGYGAKLEREREKERERERERESTIVCVWVCKWEESAKRKKTAQILSREWTGTFSSFYTVHPKNWRRAEWLSVIRIAIILSASPSFFLSYLFLLVVVVVVNGALTTTVYVYTVQVSQVFSFHYSTRADVTAVPASQPATHSLGPILSDSGVSAIVVL